MVLGVFNSGLYQSFTLNTNLLLISYWWKYEHGYYWEMFHVLLWCIQNKIEYVTPNKNCQVIQAHQSSLGLLFSIYCFFNVVLYSSRYNKWKSFEDVTWLFKLFLFNLCNKLRTTSCDAFALLFFWFINIFSMLMFRQ